MPKLFPGILYAIAAGIPGIWLAVWLSSPRIRDKPPGELFDLLLSATPKLLPIYVIPTLVYGSLAWLLLRAVGQLHLPSISLASLLPVLAYWTYSIVVYGWEPRAPLALVIFAVPAFVIGVFTWWFTVGSRVGA